MQNVYQYRCRSDADIYKSAGQTRGLHALILDKYSNYPYLHFCSSNNIVTSLCYDNYITVSAYVNCPQKVKDIGT